MPTKSKFISRSGFQAQLPVLALPILFVVSALWVRALGGPNWLWFNLDPDYFYLLDALNILNLTTPGHVYHPGTTVQWLAALILRLTHPVMSFDNLTGLVLAESEFYLGLIAVVFTMFNGLALWALGAVGRRVFGGWTAALFLQLAPFMSMVVLKHSYHVKPEALLVLTMLVQASTAVLSLTPGLMARRRWRFAIAFGVIAGFGVATKITAFPVFLLPVFVLGIGAAAGRWAGAALLYGVSALAALVIFTLPAIGAYDVFFAWMMTVSQGSGAYGGEGSVDGAVYLQQVFKLFKRPAFHVTFILSVFVLAMTARRGLKKGIPFAPEAWLLAGIAVSQLAHVLLIAKQPNAMYLIPSFVLIPLAFVLVWRLGEGLLPWPLKSGVAVLLAVLVVAQGAAVVHLGEEQADKFRAAVSVDMDRFKACARVYSYAASSRSYALMLADYVTGGRFAGRLAAQGPSNDYWLEHWWDQSRMEFRGWRGRRNIQATLAQYPCVAVRATHWGVIERLLPGAMPGLTFDQMCSTPSEIITVRGADCQGRVKQP
ncbi:MAG: hypothetical protein HQ494_10325 [Rhodospirillales bacterium]|nr:hypothetical protein [Rhodospirillales bacterium]